MVEGKIAKAWTASCIWQIVLGTVLYCLLGAGIFGAISITSTMPLPPDLESIRPWAMGLCAGGFVFIPIAGVAVWAIWTIRQRAQRFDEIFLPLGLQDSGYLTNGRQYHGSFGGHPVQIYFYRGPVLDIYFKTPIQTRLAVGTRSALGTALANKAGSLTGVNQVERPALLAAGLQASGIDAAWSQALLADPQAEQKVIDLVSERSPVPPGPYEIRSLVFAPGSLLLKLYRVPVSTITAENIRLILNNLLSLLHLAESQPEPEVTTTASKLEQMILNDRAGFNRRVIWITLGIFFALFLFMMLIMVGFLYLMMQG